jgi:sigma-B regulation protein RsbQ
MPTSILRRNNVRVTGTGATPMLFVHGFGCDQNMWRHVAPAFEADYRVVLMDYVGSGRSDISAWNPQRYATLDGYATDVLEVCDALALERVILVGHSVSAMVGVLAANREPARFASLVMIGPSPRYLNDSDGYIGGFERADIDGLLDTMDRNFMGWAAALAPQIMRNPERPELASELEASFCSTDPIVARQFAKATFLADNRADLSHVTVPSLIMQCSDDLIAPLDVGDYLHAHLPNSTLRVLEATGHCPQLSHPEETTRVLRDYLAAGTR